ncbi:hypothetical protein [Neptuniibacter sp.]|uniref:hypothetical protein n=1 Tax=Neptuniibacter sp. TaxID=1962643 RepID=UPI003B596058
MRSLKMGLDLLVAAFDCNNHYGLRTSCSAMIASQSLNQGIKGTNSGSVMQKIKKAIQVLEMHDLFACIKMGLDLLVAAFDCNNPFGLRTSCSAMIASQSLNQVN